MPPIEPLGWLAEFGTDIGAYKSRVWGKKKAPKSVLILTNHPNGAFGGIWFSWNEPIFFYSVTIASKVLEHVEFG